MRTKFALRILTLIASLAALYVVHCGGGTNTIVAPTIEAIRTALGQNNLYGMVPGFSLGAITIPECTADDASPLGSTVTYSIADLPAWLAFDASTRAVTLASGAVVPAEANTAAEVTYICTDSSNAAVTASRTFTINDLDGGGVVDGKEYENGAIPLSNFNGYFSLNPGNVDLYRPSAGSFKISTGIVRPTLGMDPRNAVDDTADFDGDSLANIDEITGGTNPFVYATSGQFGAVSSYPLTSGGYEIVSADFNRDGKMDIATAKPALNTVSVLLGNGDGTFGSDVDFGVGPLPWGVTAADFNGDGNMDLAVANNLGSTVSVLLGDGTGGFGAHSDYSTGNGATSLTAADFNNDGNVDLAVANQASGTVSILLGQGDGTFAARTDYPTGASPMGVIAADFNGDGNMDIAATNSLLGLNTFSILLGIGDGTFNPKTDYPTGTQPMSIIAADFNGDSVIDIAAGNNTTTTIAVSLGVGDGSFGAPAEFTTGNQPRSIIASDFNGDNKVDLATANTGAGAFSVSVLLGLGDGSFSTHIDYAFASPPIFLTVCDFNADGAIDLAASIGGGATNFGVLLNQL